MHLCLRFHGKTSVKKFHEVISFSRCIVQPLWKNIYSFSIFFIQISSILHFGPIFWFFIICVVNDFSMFYGLSMTRLIPKISLFHFFFSNFLFLDFLLKNWIQWNFFSEKTEIIIFLEYSWIILIINRVNRTLMIHFKCKNEKNL